MVEEEENLLTILKRVDENTKNIAEALNTINTTIGTSLNTSLLVASDIAVNYYEELQEIKKILKWYAERSTGRKYT